VRVADEDSVHAELRLVRVKPQPLRGQINCAALELECQGGHRDNLAVEGRESSADRARGRAQPIHGNLPLTKARPSAKSWCMSIGQLPEFIGDNYKVHE